LSNFYPCKIEFDGAEYENAEAAFQAQKTMNEAERLRFCALDASSAKKLGRRVNLRQDWEAAKDGIMLGVVRNKFMQNPEIAQKLLETGYAALIEGNTWGDRYWGVCDGQGQNKLGYILMYVRAEIGWGKLTTNTKLMFDERTR
jgi:ribA/ribD-fused uncharacterized protein